MYDIRAHIVVIATIKYFLVSYGCWLVGSQLNLRQMWNVHKNINLFSKKKQRRINQVIWLWHTHITINTANTESGIVVWLKACKCYLCIETICWCLLLHSLSFTDLSIWAYVFLFLLLFCIFLQRIGLPFRKFFSQQNYNLHIFLENISNSQ